MRMAILCHEFSHFYMNKVTKDEIEADLLAAGMDASYQIILTGSSVSIIKDAALEDPIKIENFSDRNNLKMVLSKHNLIKDKTRRAFFLCSIFNNLEEIEILMERLKKAFHEAKNELGDI